MIPKDAQKVYCTGCIHALKLSPIADEIVCNYCEMGKMPSNFNILVVNKQYENIDKVIRFYRVDLYGIDYIQRKKMVTTNQEAANSVRGRSRFKPLL